jgi:hypothetical protein
MDNELVGAHLEKQVWEVSEKASVTIATGRKEI